MGYFIFKWVSLHSSIPIVSTQVSYFNYCYLTLIIVFDIYHLFVPSEVVMMIVLIILFKTIHSSGHSQMVPSIVM